ncbi:protein tyrosine kinase [Gordonia sp. JH63]|uniref:YveK family protein n=1 Tax=Gordonia sp. JH63 TaxID=2698900 RepID=UPI00131FF5D4|nr:protein tyrosine kinase [Gordonia sp. JH63]QHD84817.1 protein tyrosine kinase [Gordonia sp. JH63]
MRSPSSRRPSDYLGMVRRNIVVVVASSLAAVLVGLGVFALTPETYEARSSALVLAPGPSSVAAEQASDLAGQLRTASYMQLATSDQVLARLVVDDDAGVLGDGVTLDELRGRLIVTSPPDTAVLEIVATGPTSQAAMYLADGVVEVLRDLVVELEWSSVPIARPLHAIDVIDSARAPDSPILPDLGSTLGTAAALGLVVALLLVVAVELGRDRVVGPREARVPRAPDHRSDDDLVGAQGGTAR